MSRRPSLEDLVRGVATCTRAAGGFLNKTKLLKLLYLLDVEFFRKHGEGLTPFRYIFYKYGPWDPAYDSLLAEMSRAGTIKVTPGTRTDLDTQFIDTPQPISPAQLFQSSEDAWLFKQVVKPWLDLPTGRILDYVYFSTEPMLGAQKGEALDFGKIDRTINRYSRTLTPPPPPDKVRAMRERLMASARTGTEPQLRLSPEPRFDEIYWDSVAAADSDD